ncbi:winged helix-turn-helix transcriptional regulator [Nocardia blacklockiae]|uniref:winged helix-turn-helix transcriptional regulator n=1 Tax=Nocardia blacklockiae TaxID=480036 RepID=UPI0018956D8C|nr:helix-turn-helix domain-containing protein [Nocardia blacklockiae]MBF6175237.1 helix-turn-helix transcriptional regulator [Nocardia blacklockiae]
MRSARRPGAGRPQDPPHAAMELLGQRWMLRVIWELEPGPIGFLELRRRMGNCSSSMLSVRLQHLQGAGLALKRPDKAWELTASGQALGTALRPLWSWSRQWSGAAEGAD